MFPFWAVARLVLALRCRLPCAARPLQCTGATGPLEFQGAELSSLASGWLVARAGPGVGREGVRGEPPTPRRRVHRDPYLMSQGIVLEMLQVHSPRVLWVALRPVQGVQGCTSMSRRPRRALQSTGAGGWSARRVPAGCLLLQRAAARADRPKALGQEVTREVRCYVAPPSP